jgi:translation initiation factor RLI1
LGSTLVAYGERGVTALRNAERAGRSICFYRSAHLHEENARLREEYVQLHDEVERLRAAIRRGRLVDAA